MLELYNTIIAYPSHEIISLTINAPDDIATAVVLNPSIVDNKCTKQIVVMTRMYKHMYVMTVVSLLRKKNTVNIRIV